MALVVPDAPGDPKRAWATVRDAADLGDHLWKDMRTTFATWLNDEDVPEPVIAALLGHSHRSKVTRLDEPGFQPLPRRLVERLVAECVGKGPQDALLYVPSHTARELDRILERAGIPKRIEGEGKVDFHATRTAYATLVVEAGANAKEAQSLVRHSTPQLTMKLYARARNDRLTELAEKVGEVVLGSVDDAEPGQSEDDPGQPGAPILPPWDSLSVKEKVSTGTPNETCEEEVVVEAGGIEPPSRSHSSVASTSIVLLLISPSELRGQDLGRPGLCLVRLVARGHGFEAIPHCGLRPRK